MKNYFSFSFLEKAERRLFPSQFAFTVCIPKPFGEIRRLDHRRNKSPKPQTGKFQGQGHKSRVSQHVRKSAVVPGLTFTIIFNAMFPLGGQKHLVAKLLRPGHELMILQPESVARGR